MGAKDNMSGFVFDNQVLCLTSDFYNMYPNPPYVEILRKANRPYNCLLLQSSYDYFVCVPYRTEVRHKYAYKFTSSYRSVSNDSGLDYTKVVIVSDVNSHYLSTVHAVVDVDEYKETRNNINIIVHDVSQYIDDYVNHCMGSVVLHKQDFLRRYRYSTLSYFHKELNIRT